MGRHNHSRSQAPRLIGSRASGPASKAITPHVPTMGKWVSNSRIKVGLHSLFRGCRSLGPDDDGTFQTPVRFGKPLRCQFFFAEKRTDTNNPSSMGGRPFVAGKPKTGPDPMKPCPVLVSVLFSPKKELTPIIPGHQ